MAPPELIFGPLPRLELQLLYTSIHPDDREDKDTIAETLFDRYTGELSFGDTVHLVSHGLKLHKEAIWRLALVVGRWLLLTDGNELKHHDLGKYKLSSAAELELVSPAARTRGICLTY